MEQGRDLPGVDKMVHLLLSESDVRSQGCCHLGDPVRQVRRQIAGVHEDACQRTSGS